MYDFEIFADSASNIPDHLREERGIHVVPYICTIDGNEFSCIQEGVKYEDIAKEFYARMRAGADVKSSLIVEERFVSALSPVLEAGKDAVLITISSQISGTYQQAVAAKKTLETQFPARKVYVLDSKNAGLAEGLLTLKVADLRDMGQSAKACAEWWDDNVFCMNSYFTVDDLKYLRKGGRISRTLAFAGSLLNIKPLLKGDANAKIAFCGKSRGRKKALAAIVEAFDKHVIRPESQTIAIAHADCEAEAMELAETLKAHGASDVIVEYYDLCTGIHVGPGTIALFFFGTDRRTNAPAPETGKQSNAAPEKVSS